MKRIECPYEQLLREAGYIQVYDGQVTPKRDNDISSLQPEDRRFFIRYYQQVKNNHFTNKYVKLVYDLKTSYCDPHHYDKAPDGFKLTEKMLVPVALTK